MEKGRQGKDDKQVFVRHIYLYTYTRFYEYSRTGGAPYTTGRATPTGLGYFAYWLVVVENMDPLGGSLRGM